MTVAEGEEPNSFDPQHTLGPDLNPNTLNILEPLFTINQQKRIAPFLAKSYQASPDGKTITIVLNSGIKFHDGTPLDAKAVAWNINRGKDPTVKPQTLRYYEDIQKVDVVNSTTLLLHLSEPSAVLPYEMTTPTSAIISPASATKNGNSYANIVHPVGTGPFQFVSYTPGQQVVMSRFDGYWGQKAGFQKLVYRIVPEANTRESLLLAGQADVVLEPPFSDLKNLQSNSSVHVDYLPSTRDVVISIDTKWPGLTDPRVRQALNYAVDKQGAIKAVLDGHGTALTSSTASNVFGSCNAGSYPYDPQKAKQLLQAAGATNLHLKFISPTGRYPQDYQSAQVVANDLKAVGVDAQLQTAAWPTILKDIVVPANQQTFPLQLLGYGTSPDAGTNLLMFTKAAWPPANVGMNFYSDPTVEALYAQQNRTVDPTKRQQLLCELQQKVWQAAPWIFLWNVGYPVAYSSHLTGMSYNLADPEEVRFNLLRPSS